MNFQEARNNIFLHHWNVLGNASAGNRPLPPYFQGQLIVHFVRPIIDQNQFFTLLLAIISWNTFQNKV